MGGQIKLDTNATGTISIYLRIGDHNPAHVHVIFKKGEKDASIEIETGAILRNTGFKPKELRAFQAIVLKNQDRYLDLWNEFNKP